MAIHNFLDNKGLGAYKSNTLTECEECSNRGQVNLINDYLFYSEQHFINIHSRKRELSILSLNIRSINANYTEFR